MQPHYDRFQVFTDEPLVLVFDQSLDSGTVTEESLLIYDFKTEEYLDGELTLQTTTVADDTLVFTPLDGVFPWGERLQVTVDAGLSDLFGNSFVGTLPTLGVFVANIPNDLQRPEVPVGPGFPVSLYVNSNVLLGFNPIDPESTDPTDINRIPGMSGTEAWKLHTGDPAVLIAVIDDGTNSLDNAELSERTWINRGEVPAPTRGSAICDNWDCNGDGRFSPADYAYDGQLSDGNGNGRLDLEDVFEEFSDLVDNDDNGYVDDISGWDFFRNVNTPLGVSSFPEGTHGHMRMEDAVAIADNGIGEKPGFCPNCSVVVVRTGEAIMTEFNLLTKGMEYAVSLGADVIIMATGVADYSYECEQAYSAAYESGIFLVAASGDELGFHHVYPAAGEDVYSIKAIMPLPPVEFGPIDLSNLAFVESYCTNYGAHTEATGVTGACSSEATSNTGGIAGLLMSYARNQGLGRLTPGEVRQLINMTADDIKDSCLAFNLQGCKEGWEQNFGYGRINAYKAMLALGDPLFGIPERIPPDLRITAPRWWTTIDPAKDPTMDVEAEIYARGRAYQWVLQLGFGVEPNDDEFVQVDSGSGIDRFSGVLSTINIADFVDDTWLHRQPQGSNDFTITLRLQAWWTPDVGDPVKGEIRKAIAWHSDDDPDTGLLPEFPKFIGASGVSSPIFYDLDGDPDGALEIVFATALPSVEVFKYVAETKSFEEAPGFPVELPAFRSYEDSVIASTAVGQVFGDGIPYIAVATNQGLVYLVHPDGDNHSGGPFVAGFPVSAMEPDNETPLSFGHGNAFLASPVLADLDLDGMLEIIAASYDQHAYAWKVVDENSDGKADSVPGWPVPLYSDAAHNLVPPEKICDTTMPAQVLGTPVVGILDPNHTDLNISTHPAVIVPTSEVCEGSGSATGRVYAIYWNGTENENGPFLPGWPAVVMMPLGGELPIPPLTIGMTSSPAAVRYNGELIVGVGSFFWLPQLIHWDGGETRVQHLWSDLNLGVTANGTFARFDDSDDLWYFFPTAGFIQKTENGFRLAAFNIVGWRMDNLKKPAWRKNFEDINFFVNPVLADLNNDGLKELMAGSGGYLIHANDMNLDEPTGWPKFTQNWLTSSVTVGDLDGDRTLETVAVTQEGNFWAWRTAGNSCEGNRSNAEWPRFHHDPYNSGLYGLDAVPPRLVRDLKVYKTGDPAIFEIRFTAPGDDEDCGTAASYDIRYSASADADLRDPEVWAAATAITPPTPIQGGEEVSYQVEVPDAAVFAMRSYDDANLVSYISNLATPEDGPADDDDDDDNDDATPDDDTPGDDDDNDDNDDAVSPTPAPAAAEKDEWEDTGCGC
ncbi:MAG: hypothetical protein GX444_06665 [Myxococcales bacterium]|nr:hypothetical protein [Myxococcales bacterium]